MNFKEYLQLSRASRRLDKKLIRRLLYSISQVKIIADRNTFFSEISNHDRVCILSRQRLYKHFNNEDFFAKVLIAKSKNIPLAYPIPKNLRPVFYAEEIKLSKLCGFLMALTYCKLAIFGFLRVVLNSKIYTVSAKSSIYLHDVSPSFISLGDKSVSYLKWIIESQSHKGQTVFHDAADSEKESNLHFFPLNKCGCATFFEVIKSQISGAKWILLSLYRALSGDISYIFLLDDIICFKRSCNAANLQGFQAAYFHNTDYMSRPLWTLSDSISCEVKFLFYSTNNHFFEFKLNPNDKTFNGWQLSVWDHVLVWDDINRSFVEREFYEYISIENTGAFEASGTVKPLSIPNRKAIACFDVQPHRRSRFIKLGLESNFYIGDEAIDFLKKTYAFCKANNYIMIHKRKRDIGNLISKRYVKVLNNFDSNYYIQVDTDISASSIINSLCSLAI